MKTALKIILIVLALILLGCNQNPNQETTESVDNVHLPIEGKPSIQSKDINANRATLSEEFRHLIPIDTVNSKSTNVYEIYGIEFSGNCYACDLAELSITERKIKLSNVCDEKLNKFIAVLEVTTNDAIIKIRTENFNLVFVKIDNAPIYELQITDGKFESENLRISKYYTFKKLLVKFKEHDCGDFDG
jgi:hypothetical protein